MIKYILLVYNGCFVIKELWHWYVVRDSNGFHVVVLTKFDFVFGVSYLSFIIFEFGKIVL